MTYTSRHERVPRPQGLAIIFAVSLLVILVFHRIKLPPSRASSSRACYSAPTRSLVSDAHQVESSRSGRLLLLFTIGIESL